MSPQQTLPGTPCGPRLVFRYDFRAPGFGAHPADQLAAALDQAAYAETRGVDRVQISEHHHAPDGYCPAPFVAAAAFAARTRIMTVRLSALIVPLHDPVRAAENLAYLDLLSRGRLQVTVAAGYRRVEFDAMNVPFAGRSRRVAEIVGFFREAWKGEPVTFNGRPVLVRPTPFQGGPQIIVGGSGRQAAVLAAEIGDGFDPTVTSLANDYLQACQAIGRPPGILEPKVGPFFIHVSEDPERDRALLAPHVRYEMQTYAAWGAKASQFGATPDVSLDDVWKIGSHQVLTPDECVSLIDSLDPRGALVLHPLAGGIPVGAANESVALFVDQVVPRLKRGGPRPAGATGADQPGL